MQILISVFSNHSTDQPRNAMNQQKMPFSVYFKWSTKRVNAHRNQLILENNRQIVAQRRRHQVNNASGKRCRRHHFGNAVHQIYVNLFSSRRHQNEFAYDLCKYLHIFFCVRVVRTGSRQIFAKPQRRLCERIVYFQSGPNKVSTLNTASLISGTYYLLYVVTYMENCLSPGYIDQLSKCLPENSKRNVDWQRGRRFGQN